jgi:(E)-4-hydroxy-3-methylbut-2-enyl-diphosphate synthase
VFIDGKKAATLRGPTLAADFKQMVIDYIERRWGKTGRSTTGRSNVEEYSSFA